MDAARKSYDMAAQVRNNSEEVKNVVNDLYSWVKDIKDKEMKQIQSQQQLGGQENDMDNKESHVPPVRSHIKVGATPPPSTPQVISNLTACNGQLSSPLDSPTEKRDTALDPLELRHKEANEMKDRGNRFVKMGDYNNAISEYTQAIELYPEDAVYFTNRALCHLKLERYNQCIEDCDRATDIDNLALKAYYRRMQANESLGNNMDALKDCTTVLMIEPKNMEAKRSLERINERLRKNVKVNAPNFSSLRSNIVDILPIEKPAYKRSTKPLKRVAITDVVVPKDSKNQENLKISDEDIDKLFNSNCGYFEEIKDPELILKSKQKLDQTNKSLSEGNNNAKNIPATSKELHNNNNNNSKAKCEPIVKNKSSTGTVKEQNKLENIKEIITKQDSNKLEAKTAKTEDAIKEIKNERPIPAAPKSTAQFYSNWKELSPTQKYQYLKGIHVPNLCRILGAGFDSDTLTDVIRTLYDYYLPQKDAAAMASTLLEISKNKQVPILSLLMSNEERKALSELVNSLQESNSVDGKVATAAEQIMQNFNLN